VGRTAASGWRQSLSTVTIADVASLPDGLPKRTSSLLARECTN